jgi:hypothetical protein
MTILEYIFLILFFCTGYFFIIAFIGYDRQYRTLAGAFPLGCCIWGATTLLMAAQPLLSKDVYGFNLPAAFVATGIIMTISVVISIKRHKISLPNFLAIIGGIFIISFLYYLFTELNVSIITPDSLHHIRPQQGLENMKNIRGFNTTHALLAGLISQDRYFFAYHPLFATSLLLVMGEFIFFEIQSAINRFLPAVCCAIVGPLLLASCFITTIHAFYVNNHILVAMLIMFSLSFLIDEKNYHQDASTTIFQNRLFLSVIIISFLGILRLEGQLYAILLLIITLGHSSIDSNMRFKAFLLFTLLTAPVQLFMVFFTNGKVSPASFGLIFLTTLFLPIFFALKKPKISKILQNNANYCVLFVIGICIITFFLMSYGKMTTRLGWVLHNMFDESYWGFVYQTVFVAMSTLLGLRLIFHEPKRDSMYRRIDLVLMFYLAALLLMVFMLRFHGARLGWSDSQNRMLMHFLPVGIVWISIQLGLGFCQNTTYAGQKKISSRSKG